MTRSIRKTLKEFFEDFRISSKNSSEVFGLTSVISGIPRMTFGSRSGSPGFFRLTLEIFVVICTVVTLVDLVLPLNCTVLSQS